MILVVVLVMMQEEPVLLNYGPPEQGFGDHLLPAEALPRRSITMFGPLAASVLNVPATDAMREDGDPAVMNWALIFPSFKAEHGYTLFKRMQKGDWFVRGTTADQSVWDVYHPFLVDVRATLDQQLLTQEGVDAVLTEVTLRQCEASVAPTLAIRFTNAMNARLAKVRPDVQAYEGVTPPPPAVSDGTTYWFGGVAFGRTRNFAPGPDTARLRAAADAMTAYCFDPTPSTEAALSLSVIALEDSEPG